MNRGRHHLLLLHKQVHDRKDIAGSPHAYIYRARLTACELGIFSKRSIITLQNTPIPLFEEQLRSIPHWLIFGDYSSIVQFSKHVPLAPTCSQIRNFLLHIMFKHLVISKVELHWLKFAINSNATVLYDSVDFLKDVVECFFNQIVTFLSPNNSNSMISWCINNRRLWIPYNIIESAYITTSNLPLPHKISDCLFSSENDRSMKFKVHENLAPSPLNLI